MVSQRPLIWAAVSACVLASVAGYWWLSSDWFPPVSTNISCERLVLNGVDVLAGGEDAELRLPSEGSFPASLELMSQNGVMPRRLSLLSVRADHSDGDPGVFFTSVNWFDEPRDADDSSPQFRRSWSGLVPVDTPASPIRVVLSYAVKNDRTGEIDSYLVVKKEFDVTYVDAETTD